MNKIKIPLDVRWSELSTAERIAARRTYKSARKAGFSVNDSRYMLNTFIDQCMPPMKSRSYDHLTSAVPSERERDSGTESELRPGIDYEIATCPNCGEVEHTPDELEACYDSILGPPRRYNDDEYNDDEPTELENRLIGLMENDWIDAGILVLCAFVVVYVVWHILRVL